MDWGRPKLLKRPRLLPYSRSLSSSSHSSLQTQRTTPTASMSLLDTTITSSQTTMASLDNRHRALLIAHLTNLEVLTPSRLKSMCLVISLIKTLSRAEILQINFVMQITTCRLRRQSTISLIKLTILLRHRHHLHLVSIRRRPIYEESIAQVALYCQILVVRTM